MSTNVVLSTPLSIYNAIEENVPGVRCQLKKSDPIELEFIINKELILRINSAVNQSFLLLGLVAAKLKIAFDYEQIQVKQQPLSDLQAFTQMQRQIYEYNGKRCLDVVIDYLKSQDPQPSGDLMTLGLSPEQLTLQVALPYFVEIAQRSPDLLPVLKAKYTKLFPLVQLELCKKDFKDKNIPPSDYHEILEKLRKRVLGQEGALQKVAAVLAEDKVTNGNHRAFLFVGPTGVGKTELSMAIGDVKGKYISFYMNQYSQEHETTRFFGSPMGYVGSTDKPDLANELDKCPERTSSNEGTIIEIKNVVLLFDELEKAHPKIRQSLLTLFEKGEVVVSYTNNSSGKNVKILYKLVNCIMIGTSNLFQKEIMFSFQQGHSENKIADMFIKLNQGLGDTFSPEFLGRLKVIPFGPISKAIFKEILKTKMEGFFNELKNLLEFKEMTIENDQAFFDSLSNKLYGNGTDIRKIKKHLSDVKSILLNHFAQTHKTDKKIIFYSEKGMLWVKLHQFCLGEYVDLSTLLPPLSIDLV